MLPFASSNLPPGIERAALHAPVYLILQPIRCTAISVTGNTGGLLPRLFTLIPTPHPPYGHPLHQERNKGKVFMERFFSVTLLCPYEQLSVRKYGALCCPDFPHYQIWQRDKPVSCFTLQRYKLLILIMFDL